ncbi:methyltransferase domain-containing protein [Glaciihabitans sp. UYNi722]|uniref:class I SAM-dependent methyltransferase n=1 Tax=Glaciihabitans sp. UYNi722 TaxID=3156344 RepID=UPI003392607E
MIPENRTDFDAELRRHNDALRQAASIRPGDHILDIGCGTGQTTRQAAETAREGSAVGIDVSAASIARARQLATAAKLRNIAFEHADAQTHLFPPGHFDVAISRFGTMFFDDPAAAFVNIRTALRPAGRLVMAVWQTRERNEWIVELNRTLHTPGEPVAPDAGGLDPFSLADPSTVTELLEAAGFANITFAEVSEPVYYGADIGTALEWIGGFTCTSQTLRRLDPPGAQSMVTRLRQLLAAHMTDNGVWFNSSSWIITAEVAQ